MLLCVATVILQRLNMPLIYRAVFIGPKSDTRFLACQPFINICLDLTIKS